MALGDQQREIKSAVKALKYGFLMRSLMQLLSFCPGGANFRLYAEPSEPVVSHDYKVSCTPTSRERCRVDCPYSGGPVTIDSRIIQVAH